MKRTIVACFSILCTFASLAAEVAAKELVVRRGPPKHHGRPSGGLVEKNYTGNVFRVFNAQDVLDSNQLQALTTTIRRSLLLPIECEQVSITDQSDLYSTADKLVSKNGVGAAALIISNPSLPVLIISPDRRWGILNVASIANGNPDPEKLVARFTKLYWNVIARTLGAGNSSYPGCVLMPFSNMDQLDAIHAFKPCPEPFNKMIDTGAAYGIGILTVTTYRVACEQGWAPDPTNDVQKAIKAEVNAEKERGPTNALQIKP